MTWHKGRNNSRYACVLRLTMFIAATTSLLFGKAATSNQPCSPKAPIQDFYVNLNGDITNSGRSAEGPVCVQVHYNRLRFNLSVNFQTTYSKGVDGGTLLLTGTAPTAQAGAVTPPSDLLTSTILPALVQLDRNAGIVADGVRNLTALVTFVDTSIAPGKTFPEVPLKDKYKTLVPALRLSRTLQFQALPTDLNSGTCPPPNGTPAPGSVLAILLGYQSDSTFYAANKDNVDRALALANRYKCNSPDEADLTKNIAILKFWDGRFLELGLSPDLSDQQLAQLQLTDFFVDSTQLNCGNIFNQSSSTTASITDFDESQTLNGTFTPPSAHQVANFFTLTCSSPFAISAGIEFSTIPAREFGIIKSTGGPNNTTVNKFGYTSNSSFHPLPVGAVHVRLWDSTDHRFALHASSGVSGNIQGQNSGGSSAEFLMGGSLSFFRTMFLTAGLHVGTESALAGGFKVGDVVPSDVTSVQVTKSYRTGFGIAITFTKP